MLEALFEPDRFIKVLPVFASAKVHDVLMLIKGIELYEAGFLIDLTIRPGSSVKDSMARAFPRPVDQTLQDNLGNEYSLYHRMDGGRMGEWRSNYTATPTLGSEVTTLTLEIPRLEFQEPSMGMGLLTAKSVLNGPWTFTLTIPAREMTEEGK